MHYICFSTLDHQVCCFYVFVYPTLAQVIDLSTTSIPKDEKNNDAHCLSLEQ